jgi:hypothetical protein
MSGPGQDRCRVQERDHIHAQMKNAGIGFVKRPWGIQNYPEG